jgi:hypothetical protein
MRGEENGFRVVLGGRLYNVSLSTRSNGLRLTA